jgi:hypothetical protein
MILQAPDAYDMSVKNFGMKPADFGEGALPQDGGPYGTLTGGSLKMISPSRSCSPAAVRTMPPRRSCC